MRRSIRSLAGRCFFVKFGKSPRDPIWPVDIFLPQVGDAPAILGSMLADAEAGFPIPMYPRCLQKAHENAALVDFLQTPGIHRESRRKIHLVGVAKHSKVLSRYRLAMLLEHVLSTYAG